MATWITDRTQADIDRVKELTAKARSGTWTEEEQSEWAAGMKGALSYTDYNRIESGMKELAGIVGASVSVKTDWTVNGYLTESDASRWIKNVEAIHKKCGGYSTTPRTPESLSYSFKVINQVEKVLADIEKLAKDRLLYCSEPICGGEPYYAVY